MAAATWSLLGLEMGSGRGGIMHVFCVMLSVVMLKVIITELLFKLSGNLSGD